MAIPQSEIYSRVIDQPFESESYTKELEGNSKNIKFEKGSKTVKVSTVSTAGTVVAHNASKTYSAQLAEITNVNATQNTYTLDQSFKITQFIDKEYTITNNSITGGAIVLQAITSEQLIPKIDAYRLAVLAGVAESTTQTVLATADGYKDFLKARAFLINSRLGKNMIAYVGTATADSIRLSDTFKPATSGLEDSMRTGTIGKVAGISVKEVPADLMPSNVGAVIVNPEIVSAPRFLDDVRIEKAAGAFGELILALYIYTCVVSKPKQKGIATIKTA